MGDTLYIHPGKKIIGDIIISGDKSISHRAIILSSIGEGVTHIENLLLSDDVLSTINIMRELGVTIEKIPPTPLFQRGEKRESVIEHSPILKVHGVGRHRLKPPKNPLNCGNSGTTMRLLCGLLSAQKFNSVLIGDNSLMKRPMARMAEPLRLMGAKINLSENNTAPIDIIGNQKLNGIDYELFIPSAQVKSGILLASLYVSGETIVREKTPTRDHTERMLKNPPGSLRSPTPFCKGGKENDASSFPPLKKGGGGDFIKIPGDISSTAFFIVLACITKNSDVIIREVGINPFRTGIIDILKLMGANIEIFNNTFFGLEPVADIRIQYAPLNGIIIPQELISNAIDEFPAILIAAATAKGKTILRNAVELRVKESDRIRAMCAGFQNSGVTVHEYDDGVMIEGPQTFLGGKINSFGDHRIAMAFSIAGNIANGSVIVDNCANVATSFPGFVTCANQLGMKISN